MTLILTNLTQFGVNRQAETLNYAYSSYACHALRSLSCSYECLGTLPELIKIIETVGGVVTLPTLKTVTASFNSNENSLNSTQPVGSSSEMALSESKVVSKQHERMTNLSAPSQFEDWLSHPLLIHHVHITSVTTATVISSDIMALFFATAVNLKKKLDNFYYFDTDIEITAVVQGQPFAAGLVALAFLPNPIDSASYTDFKHGTQIARISDVNTFVLPHLLLDPSKNKQYRITLPCPTMTGHYTRGNHNLGSYQMYINPIVALFSGTATSASMDVCLYMTLKNPRFHGLTLLSNEFEDEKKPGGTLSAIANTASELAASIAPASGFLSPYVTLFSTVSGAVGSVLKFFGFSKPPAVENSHFILNRLVDNYSQFDGKSTALVLAGSQTTSVGINPILAGGKMDEMSIAYLCKKKGLFGKEVITQAMAFGHSVVDWYIRPGMINSVSTQYEVTPMAGIAKMFNYWCGDMTIDLLVVASVFHRATLLVVWDPDGNPSGSMEAAVQTLKSATLTVAGNTHVSIRIPWQQGLNYLPIAIPFVDAENNVDEMSNGTLSVYVQNPVTANGSTDGITLLAFASSDNINFYGPSATHIPEEIILLSVDFVDEIQQIEFGPKTELANMHLHSFGEEYSSVKQLACKVSMFAHKSTATTATDLRLIMEQPNVPVPLKAAYAAAGWEFHYTFASWLVQAYLGYRGGMRSSIHAMADTGFSEPYYWGSHILEYATYPADAPMNTYLSSGTPGQLLAKEYAFTTGNRAVCPNLDVVVPSQLPYDYFPLRGPRVEIYADNIRSGIALDRSVANVSITFLSGAADDAQFVWFLGFPTLGVPTP